MTKEGTFREDLYYRLLVVPIRVPPLRERNGDVEELAQHFFVKSRAKHSRLDLTMTSEVLQRLCEHSWPGNVRELQNAVERMVLLARASELSVQDLPDFLTPSDPVSEGASAPILQRGLSLEAFEKQVILDALKQFGGNQTTTARHLGISRRTLAYRLEKYGVMGETLKALRHGAA